MLISKFDLYKSEWLELVFENRNKRYGAYQLRKNHNRDMVLAMTITFIGVGVLFGVGNILESHHMAAPADVHHVFNLAPPPEQPIRRIPPPAIPHPLPPPPVATVRFVPSVVTVDADVTERPPQITELNAAISTTTNKGRPGELPLTIDEPANTASAVTEDKTVHPLYDIQVYPSPVGGEEAWSKFLNKNLRYPPEAQDAGVSGRVYMSFIIEKDGSLSNITVERGAGYGFDKEATRVLRLAKAWKPGLQNGRPVRVKFIIPINFQFSDQP
jgi:protein TonB